MEKRLGEKMTPKIKLAKLEWALTIILSYCGALALTMRFAMPVLSTEQQVNALTEIVWNLRNSLKGTSVTSTLLFGGLAGLGVLTRRMRDRLSLPPLCTHQNGFFFRHA